MSERETRLDKILQARPDLSPEEKRAIKEADALIQQLLKERGLSDINDELTDEVTRRIPSSSDAMRKYVDDPVKNGPTFQ